MTRDEFEEWLEDNREEALADIDDDNKPLGDWLRMMFRSLKVMAQEPVDEDEEVPDVTDVTDDDREAEV